MLGLRRGWMIGMAVLGAVAAGCGGSGSDSETASGSAGGAAEARPGRVRAPEGAAVETPTADSPAGEAAGEEIVLTPEIGTQVLRRALGAGRDLALLDVRTPGEYEVGHIEGALNVPIYELDAKLDEVREFQNGRELVVYCEVGGRTRRAGEILNAAGFEHVVQYIPGMREWRQEE